MARESVGYIKDLISKFETRLDECYTKIASLESEVSALKVENSLLRAENNELRIENTKLKAENRDLKQQLLLKTNSRNSSMPPSQDPFRSKDLSLRTKSGKSSGGQTGHEGSTLEFSATPTKVEEHRPEGSCPNCGSAFSSASFELKERRQVFDIPPILPVITEHRTFQATCNCGHCSLGQFPSHVKSRVQYGSNVETLVGYLSTRQFIPFERLQEFFADIMGLKLSQGSIQNMLVRLSNRLEDQYQVIKSQISTASAVGGDETGAVIDGKKGYFWGFQTDLASYIVASQNRGYETIEKEFPNGFPDAVYTHDCYAAQNKTNAKAHQQCLAHLQREIKKLQEIKQVDWIDRFKELLKQSLGLKKNLEPHQHNRQHTPVNNLFDKLNQLLYQDKIPDKVNDKAAATFYERILKHADSILTFLLYPDVEPDNNGTERLIRGVKVKQKVSGQFKSIENAQIFAKIRSVIDTAIKNKQPVFQTLTW
jgi:transposase